MPIDPLISMMVDSKTLAKKRLRKPPVTTPSLAAEVSYRKQLLKGISDLNSLARETVLKFYRSKIASRLDQINVPPNSSLTALFDAIEAQYGQEVDLPDQAELEQIAETTSNHNRRQVDRQFQSVLGVQPLQGEPWLGKELDNWVQINTGLVKSVPKQYLDKLELMVMNAFQAGTRPADLGQQISKLFWVTKNRGKLIARDQISKLTGNLTMLRQKDVGVTQYIWRTSMDERVRATHMHNEGKAFKWSDPPATGHPGQDINCRCHAEPDFKQLVSDIKSERAA